MELRCTSRLHGILTEEGLLEIKCRSSKCGARKGVVVMHYFDPETWELKDTRHFQDPITKFESNQEDI